MISQSIMATNKIVGGSMELTDQSSWLTPSWNHGTSVAEFGYTTDVPSSGQGGCFHIQGTGSDVQYAIYQAVELKAGVVYTPGAAVKIVSGDATRTTWFEVYIGPTDPATATGDYVENTAINQIKVASYFSWDKPPVVADGTLSNGNTYKSYTPTTDGTYYVLFKFGCNAATGNFEILVDNLSLDYSEAPKATFKTVGFTVGIAPFEVEFLNTSVFATSYSWDFGNGETSTDKNPSTEYDEPGIYTVKLIASNGAITDEMEQQINVVGNAPDFSKKEKLVTGDMETQGNWFVSWLDGQVQPTLTWGYTEDAVTGGSGGSLNVSADGSNRKNMCIYQPVLLQKDHVYRFDMAFKVLDGTTGDGMWVETYLENFEQPSADYKPGSGAAPNGTNLSFAKEATVPGCMGYIPTAANIAGSDGLFSENLSVIVYSGATEDLSYPFEKLTYIPNTTGMYFFVLKIGGNINKVMNLLFDNLSLSDDDISAIKQPVLDGCTIYAESGVINVNTVNKDNNRINIYNVGGLLIQSDNFSGQFASKSLQAGVYIVKINGVSSKILVK